MFALKPVMVQFPFTLPTRLPLKQKYRMINKLLFDEPNYTRILIGSYIWSIGRQTLRWRHHWQHFIFHRIKQIYFLLLFFLSSDRSQKTSTCGKNIGNSPGRFSCTALLLLPHFHVSYNILFGRRTASHNLFIKWSEKVSAIKNHFVFT